MAIVANEAHPRERRAESGFWTRLLNVVRGKRPTPVQDIAEALENGDARFSGLTAGGGAKWSSACCPSKGLLWRM